MDLNGDELRRERRASEEIHRASMGPLRELMARLLDDDSVPAAQRADAILGPLGRRQLLRIGGLSVSGAALLAACAGPSSTAIVPVNGSSPSTTAAADRVANDVTYLRTASSVEHSAIETYDKVIDLGGLPSAVTDVVKTFRDQHADHAKLFASLTERAGGQVNNDPNRALDAALLDPAFALAAKDDNKPKDLLAIAYALEQLATETYQQFTPLLSVPQLRGSLMSVGGVEGRHAAVLASLQPVYLVIPAEEQPPNATTTTGTTTTTVAGAQKVELAPIFMVPGPFQPLTSVQITIGIVTLNADPLGPNSYAYEPAPSS